MRRIDQTYTMLDVNVDIYDEDAISNLKLRYPSLAIARISATKFNNDSRNTLKFYVYHWLIDNYKSAIFDINNYYSKYKITEKVVK
jgi:hypothetical protein